MWPETRGAPSPTTWRRTFDHRPSAPISAAPRHRLAVREPRRDAGFVLVVARHIGAGAELDQRVVAAGLQQHAMQIAAMDHGIGIAEARAERLAEIDMGDLAVGQRIHQAELVDIDRHAARRFADAQPVEAVEGVGPELDAGADLAQLRGLLQHQRGDALLRQRQRRRQAADAAAGDEDLYLGSTHDLLVMQPGDLVIRQAENTRQDLVGMLAQHRRGPAAGAARRRTAAARRPPDSGRCRAGRAR